MNSRSYGHCAAAVEPELDRIAQQWAHAVAGPDVGPGMIRPGLAAIADAVVDEGSARESLVASSATALGTSLVEAGLDDAGVLQATIEAVGEAVASALETRCDFQLVQALGGVATGFATALRRAAVLDQRASEAALAATTYQAVHDPLTGLPNRALLNDRISELFRDATADTRVGLCFLDLDDFKGVNDRLGHDVGDELLVAVAQRIASVVNPHGHLAARLGGDEFVILCNGDPCAAVAEELRRALEVPVAVGDNQVRVSASVGVAEDLAQQTSAVELMRAADVAMRMEKACGKPTRSAVPSGRRTSPPGRVRDRFIVQARPAPTLSVA